MPNLVGTGLNQVPTNSMLGGLAYQDPEHASIKNLDLKNLSQINSEISGTAVDIFVYDTRKDSDGGAWRKRTQSTSWYNETLGTATRGTRREFPAVAVIVAESTQITIYDGDDPDLPMWMVINHSGAVIKATVAKNGVLYWGCSSNSSDRTLYFIKDSYYRWWTTSSYTGYFNEPISGRNGTLTGGSDDTQFLVDGATNDVAVTVLPNAPIDDTTGLPIPTIAVGTEGGVSVIKDDGTIISTTGSSYIRKINFTDDYGLNAVIENGGGANWANVYLNNFKTANGLSYGTYANWDGVVYRTKYNPKALTYKTASVNDTISNFIDMGNRSSAIGGAAIGGGLTLLDKSPKDAFDPDAGEVAFVTTSYNTGWMHGDIKRAFLSDTDTTDVTGSEKIANYNFAADFSTQWEVKNSANTSYDATNDRVTVTSTQNYSGIRLKNASLPTLTNGKRYIMTVDIHSINNPIRFGVVSGGNKDSVNSTGAHTLMFTAGASISEVYIEKPSGSNSTFVLNSVSIREAEEDRSVNNKGLQVFGTIIKTPVATGADLVGYSFNSSNSNYLEQPYNSDLDFGTGALSITAWLKIDNDNSSVAVDKSRQNGTQTNRFVLYYDGGNNNFRFYDSIGTVDSSAVQLNTWYHVVVVKEGNGSGKIYINGKLDGTSSTLTGNNSDTAHKLMIGNGYNYTYAWRGSIALVRISGTIPSPEQIKKIYDDEKCLFHENAKATLYGSSDAVTALAYDDTTNLLHVGTSAGRSEFQGLCRINNTTDAVTTAISASNGLVAEQ